MAGIHGPRCGELRSEISALAAEAERTARALSAKRDELSRLEAACGHQWGPVSTRMKEIREECVDWNAPPERHGVHIDYKTIFRTVQAPEHARTCVRCGRTESTTETKTETRRVPAFGA